MVAMVKHLLVSDIDVMLFWSSGYKDVNILIPLTANSSQDKLPLAKDNIIGQRWIAVTYIYICHEILTTGLDENQSYLRISFSSTTFPWLILSKTHMCCKISQIMQVLFGIHTHNLKWFCTRNGAGKKNGVYYEVLQKGSLYNNRLVNASV